ncbi:MAG: glycosyltransferase family 2 protein [Chitinispirillaceae bacterium]|nr:glycosyltransferase family 2 protein [Chitinispirillaceae bacterium]
MVTQALFIIALLFVLGDFLITVFTIVYQRFLYDHYLRRKYKTPFTPRCAVIIPCKGVSRDLENNLQGFLDLDYPDYLVIYAVESERDAAVGVIKRIMAGDSRARLAVAGLSTMCVQKNQNLLAGLKKAEDAEVYVFADADIRPEPSWLRELVLPLADPGITATSGFRWLHARKGTLGELAHSYVNIVIYILFSAACFIGGVGLWGGSMAIRRKDFEALKVAKKWSRAGVDDMSLSHLVLKARRKAVVVPPCVTHTDDLLPTVRGTIDWFERQIMYLKAYQKKLWFFIGFPVAISGMFFIILLPLAAVIALSPKRTFLAAGGGAATLFYIGELITIALYPLLGSTYRPGKFIVYWPFLRLTHGISYCLTALTNTITWAGIRYRLAYNGDVARIERPGDPGEGE